MKRLNIFFLFLASWLLSTIHIYCQWVPDLSINTPVCINSYEQNTVSLLADGFGGAIIAWEDGRNGNADIFAQRYNASGYPQWTIDGLGVGSAPHVQYDVNMVSDGAGGAIFVWSDGRAGLGYEIYAQRVDSSGNFVWATGGVRVCSYLAINPQIIEDGQGGAIITWVDGRWGNLDVFAQRINAAGTLQWISDGYALVSLPGTQSMPVITTDGNHGAIIAWQDMRTMSDTDIYAQRIDMNGAYQWTIDGELISSAPHAQLLPQITGDGAGGATVVWEDHRTLATTNIYAQRVKSNGSVDWATGGIPLSPVNAHQGNFDIVPDFEGGVIAVWEDGRSGNYWNIYAQRLDSTGAYTWNPSGVTVSDTLNYGSWPRIDTDENHGAVISFDGLGLDSSSDILVVRINATGNLMESGNGRYITTAANTQYYADVCSDGHGGAIAAWQDLRSGTPLQDIYANHLGGFSPLGVEVVQAEYLGVYPNPTTGLLRITCNEPFTRMELYDMYGKTIGFKIIDKDASSTYIELEDTPNGMYLVHLLLSNNRVVSKKICVSKT